MDFSSASECKVKGEKEGMAGKEKKIQWKQELPARVYNRKCLWYVFGTTLLLPQKTAVVTGSQRVLVILVSLTLSAFPVIFTIYKMTLKGCPVVVLQCVTEGSVSRVSLLTYRFMIYEDAVFNFI